MATPANSSSFCCALQGVCPRAASLNSPKLSSVIVSPGLVCGFSPLWFVWILRAHYRLPPLLLTASDASLRNSHYIFFKPYVLCLCHVTCLLLLFSLLELTPIRNLVKLCMSTSFFSTPIEPLHFGPGWSLDNEGTACFDKRNHRTLNLHFVPFFSHLLFLWIGQLKSS